MTQLAERTTGPFAAHSHGAEKGANGFFRSLAAAILLAAWPLLAGEVAITILHTNDIHQHLAPLPRIAGYVANYRAQHPNTVFVDAGDWFDRGSSLAPMTGGEAIYGAMARMGYDMWILGNHDWAYGARRLFELMQQYPVPVLMTNLATTKPPLPRNMVRTIVKEFDGIRVGFFGITLDTYGKNPKHRPYLYVLDCREETAKVVAELKKAKVNVIVAVTHLGFEKMKHEIGRSQHPSDVDLVRTNPDIDVVIGGHSHTALQDKAIRDIHEQTGAIVTQAGASARFVGRLTMFLDAATRRISRFETELVPVTDKLPEQPDVAASLRQQYDRHMPQAKVVVGELKEPMAFHNMAYWYADFVRRQAGADICLLPRKTLYDEPKSFAAGKVDIERLFGYLYNHRIVKAKVKGSDLLAFCRKDSMRDRFNPFHHKGRPFSGDAMFYSGFEITFRGDTQTVEFAIDPHRSYTLAVPWPFGRARLGQLPPLPDAVRKTGPVRGLKVTDVRVLPQTTHQFLVQEGAERGLSFTVKFPKPRPDWEPWTKHFEAKLRK
ncbi:MAG: bifunctional metallophosphatase/5'-nucleotidase [Candidatus Brocadiae bacterium]|nr:bifunctional metallophosphatase/5'-nucleotidase [Candidatus Brocadiia bacterium]